MKKDAIKIMQSGINAADPLLAIKKKLTLKENNLRIGDSLNLNLSDYENIYLIGAGKASVRMALAIEEILGNKLKTGRIITKYGHSSNLKKTEVTEAGHPVPDNNGVIGAKKIVSLARAATERDLIINLISGGGSALFLLPVDELTLEDVQQTTATLLRCGSDIGEMNIIRKHLSRVTGGRLAKLVFPAALVTLILSDVIGDPLNLIASGPTIPDNSTFADALKIIKKYYLLNKLPPAVITHIRKGVDNPEMETPSDGDPAFKKCINIVVGNNLTALKGCQKEAKSLGYNTLILSSLISGNTGEVAIMHAAIGREIANSNLPIKKPACVISGGETTVVIRGDGIGGRNQEFALTSAIEIEGTDNILILSAGTDGTDGPTDANGAWVTGKTLSSGKKLGLDATQFLRDNNSYNYFKKIGNLIITGPTGTNVGDMHLIMVK
ncbi:MAG: D-glycerate 2-kinase [Syntrophomonadaceae bacterium]|nr:D-glycerate 2-kinase [Bacillota bacterium]